MKILISMLFVFGASACGVRGKPMPPLEPTQLGRGQPSFKRNTEDYRFPETPPEPSPTPREGQ